MPPAPKPTGKPSSHQLSVEIGSWFKAYATGAGVIAIPLVLVLLLAAWLLGGRIG